MKVTVRITKSFKIAVKPLLKKYKSLAEDLARLEKELTQIPRLGTPLGDAVYKIRLNIKSKGKGKSGGARVISLIETTLISIAEYSNEEEITVYLITIYDKSELETISDKEIKGFIKSLNK